MNKQANMDKYRHIKTNIRVMRQIYQTMVTEGQMELSCIGVALVQCVYKQERDLNVDMLKYRYKCKCLNTNTNTNTNTARAKLHWGGFGAVFL